MAKRRVGRPRKIRIAKHTHNKLFGRVVKGARNPAQVRAAIARDRVRKRSKRNTLYARRK